MSYEYHICILLSRTKSLKKILVIYVYYRTKSLKKILVMRFTSVLMLNIYTVIIPTTAGLFGAEAQLDVGCDRYMTGEH